MMPDFIGSAIDASAAGYRVLKCHWCAGWVWWAPEHELTAEARQNGRVFHDHGKCASRESDARRASAAAAEEDVNEEAIWNEGPLSYAEDR